MNFERKSGRAHVEMRERFVLALCGILKVEFENWMNGMVFIFWLVRDVSLSIKIKFSVSLKII